MILRVHLLQEPREELLEELERLLVKGITLTCSEEIPDSPDYDILVCGVPSRRALEASPNLERLIIPWSGLPGKTRDLMLEFPGIRVHNIHHNAVPAAEMAITLMLAAAKDLLAIDSAFRRGDWSKRYETSRATTIAGKQALVLGYGEIGQEIAARCLGLGMAVTAVGSGGPGRMDRMDRQIKVHSTSGLGDLLPLADVLFLALPLTDTTRGLVGDRELSLMPDGSIVVNVSRGRIMEEEALYRHLKAGRLRAGLDVWYNYPESPGSRTCTPPSQLPFHELPNVVMTPHLAGHSDCTEALRARELARLLNLAAKGSPVPNPVDLSRGY
jgi:phosphoglycerate dehydrogenase-like enzyme